MGKKPIVSVISVLGFYVNGFSLSIYEKTVYIKTHKTALNRPVDHTGEM